MRLSGLCALLVITVLSACSRPAPWKLESYVFGTRVEILLAGEPDDKARKAAAEVMREFERLHRSYHAWQASELSALNADLERGAAHKVSPELAGLIRDAQQVAKQGDYLFDPGIGRLIAIWGFQSDELPVMVPPEKELQLLVKQKPSIADLTVDGEMVSSRNRAVALDFGGYLKGVALDRAATLLKQAGVTNALINIGGNVLALGNKNGAPWRVGIQHPRPQAVGGSPLASLELRDGEAIGTSGDYHRYFEINGKRYSHLIDPRNGMPADTTQAVTLLIPPSLNAGMRSDALSKPIFIAGEAWLHMARKLGVAAVLRVDATGRVAATPTMLQRLKIEIPDLKIEAASGGAEAPSARMKP